MFGKPSAIALIVVLDAILLLTGFASISFAQSAADAAHGNTSCAVVELFTSEGCSSCPPADAALADLITDARKAGTPVFALAFHVDYWNRLGWADRFSDASYSHRQSDYSRALKADNVYTPQMIVNGTDQFVGSDRAHAKQAIDAALSKPAPAKVTVEISPDKSGSYLLKYSAVGAEPNAVINLAVVERGLKSDVARGENAGRALRHENVVRWFQTISIPSDGKGQAELPRLSDVNVKNASVIAYAQASGNGQVLGAVSSDFPSEHP